MTTDRTSTASEAVKTAQRQWVEAYTKRDTALLDLCMSDDYVGIYPDGSVHDKKAEIEAIASGSVVIQSMEPLDMSVRLHGQVAINVGHSNVKVKVGGDELNAELRFTTVWAKQEAGWRAVSHQVTRIEPSP